MWMERVPSLLHRVGCGTFSARVTGGRPGVILVSALGQHVPCQPMASGCKRKFSGPGRNEFFLCAAVELRRQEACSAGDQRK